MNLQELEDAGRIPSHHDPIAPHWSCSRCGNPTLLETMSTYQGPTGLITRFCVGCEKKMAEERDAS